MGRQKRKTNSPLLKDAGKTPRTAEEETAQGDEDGRSQGELEREDDTIADLKAFIRAENAKNNKALAEEIRRYSDERMAAVENSLGFALETNETLAKRLNEVEQRAQRTEQDFCQCAKRLVDVEEQLDQFHQRELQSWLVFSGPAIPRVPRYGRSEDSPHLLQDLIQKHMNYDIDLGQIAELQRDERQMRVRFNTVKAGSDRYYLVRNKTKLRGSGLYIRERLTPFRQRLFNEIIQLKRNNRINTVFTKEGTVFVVVSHGDRPRPVRSDVALERLMQYLAEQAAYQQVAATGQQSPRTAPRGSEAPSMLTSPETEGARAAGQVDSSGTAALQRSPQLSTQSGGQEVPVRRTQISSDPESGTVNGQGCLQPVTTPGRSVVPDPARPELPAGHNPTEMEWRRAAELGRPAVSDPQRPGRPAGPGWRRTEEQSAAPGGLGEGGDNRQDSAAETSVAPAENRRDVTAAGTTGLRRRYGDIRTYIAGQEKRNKCD